MLGHTLLEGLSRQAGLAVHATVRDPRDLPRHLARGLSRRLHPDVDASDFDALVRAIAAVRPQCLVNCIGLVKQRPRASDPIDAIQINALLPHRLARLCRALGTRMIHFSTDCVFSGARGGYTEEDTPDATDLYGRTKLLGEPCEPNCITLRTSFIGHELRGRHGLIEWFLAREDKICGYTRAVFSGFPTVEITRILVEHILPNPSLTGLYHVSSAPISKYDLLDLVARRYSKRIEIVASAEPALDRSLDSSRFKWATGYRPPSWPELIDAMFRDAAVWRLGRPARRLSRAEPRRPTQG
jgi:dTDP-4-dehydrorhamnose reductase